MGRGGGVPAGAGGDATPRFRFRLIGTFAVCRDGQRIEDRDVGSRKGRTLLKALVVAAGEPLTRDHLVTVLWPADAPVNAERNVASLVSRLRSLLGPSAIEGSSGTYRLRTGPHLEVDLHDAERLANQARTHLAASSPSLAWTAAVQALEVMGDRQLLEGEPDSRWADEARMALDVLRRDLRRCGWEAALALSDADGAGRLARSALASDPLDEEACRALMRASQLRGEVAEGLLAFDRLRSVLADELGVAPSERTQQLHLALLREEDPAGVQGDVVVGGDPSEGAAGAVPRSLPAGGVVGRDEELEVLRQRWVDATRGEPGMVLVAGETGIGKTRLVETLSATVADGGGGVARTRCYEAERSLFLGPIVEILASLVRTTPPDRLRDAATPWEGTLAELVPEMAGLLGVRRYEPAIPRIERRRTFEAVSALLRSLSQHQPLLVFLDDLHNAGSSTIELLHYLLRHLSGGRVLVVATLRVEEGAEAMRTLEEVGESIELGPLPEAAVAELARQAGAGAMAARILALTRGHTLSVVETLQAVFEAEGEVDEPPLPESLRVAVLQRLQRAGLEVEELLRSAAILGSTFEPDTVAQLLGVDVEEVLVRVHQALDVRLLVEEGGAITFSNDLIREIVYQTTPRPVRVSRHGRAARILVGRPEAVATHATAAGDWARALDAWLEAAGIAAARYANRDAEQLLQRAIEAGEAAEDPAGVARARLLRGRVREALADYARALEDLEAAAELARVSVRPDLEATALRELGGDVIVGLGRPSTDCLPYLEAGLDVAQSADLGRLEVELLGRLAVVWTNRARFDLASRSAEQALERARQLDDQRAVALALDAVKNVSAYMGDLDRLQQVLPELEGILRPAGDLTLLQWCVFESVFPALAGARWSTAGLVIERALAMNRRTGHPWGSLFLAHRSWLRRVQGDYGRAMVDARLAGGSEVSAGHPWWRAFSEAMLGWVLSDAGAHDDAIAHLEQGVAAAERDGMETYLIRCVSHLALAHWRLGDGDEAARHLDRAEWLLSQVRTPPDRAFLHGAHAYAAAARLRLGRGEVEAALRQLDAVRGPAEAVGWHEIVVTDRVLRGRGHLLSGDLELAKAALDDGVAIAEGAGLRPLAWEGHVGRAHVAAEEGDRAELSTHEQKAAEHLRVIAASVDDPRLRERLVGAAERRRDALSGEPPG